MPFKRIQLRYADFSESLKPRAAFDNRNTFGHRVTQEADGKMASAYYIANEFIRDGSSVFASDGSSAFYVCLAIARRCFDMHFERGPSLVTNNLAIAHEIQAHPFQPPPRLSIQMLGGSLDYILNATFPQHDAEAHALIQSTGLAIISVRKLFFKEGPTSPEPHSCAVKYHALTGRSALLIPLDWQKLSHAYPDPGTVVFNDCSQWASILANRNRPIHIVAAKPLDQPETENTDQIGKQLDTSGLTRISTKRWEVATDYQRYCWQAYQFSLHDNVTFHEVAVVYDED